MGCVASNSAIPQKQKDLDMYLEKEHLKSSLDFKILLLGAGESGKSTVVKQLRNIHLGKSAPSEIQSFAPVLHGNAIQAMRYAIKACENLNISLNDFEDSVKVVKEHSETNSISADEANLLDKLWQSPQMKEAWGKKSSVYIPDATPYYMSNIFRFIEKDFSPSEEDIIMARVRTTGMFMTSFDAPPIHWRVVDVGGQRSERKK